ncbi:MAG: hypothetical protein HRU26_10795 [Psychroserpens sp.]|nr:hypothetical protein [Psychroserpens sp.]
MKQFCTLLLLALVVLSCKDENKERTPISVSTTVSTNELSIAEKIANAHGFEQWKDVDQIAFRFNVDRDGNVSGRSWTWNPKTDDVSLITQQDTLRYNRQAVDSTTLNADRGFINDKFWLLIPFQLAWDKGTTITEPVAATAPISNKAVQMITLLYGNEGGYTPGDAYDIYFDDNYLIQEWVFRKSNSPEPSMTTTFENYIEINGMKLAQDHKTAEGNFNLFFSDLKIN